MTQCKITSINNGGTFRVKSFNLAPKVSTAVELLTKAGFELTKRRNAYCINVKPVASLTLDDPVVAHVLESIKSRELNLETDVHNASCVAAAEHEQGGELTPFLDYTKHIIGLLAGEGKLVDVGEQGMVIDKVDGVITCQTAEPGKFAVTDEAREWMLDITGALLETLDKYGKTTRAALLSLMSVPIADKDIANDILDRLVECGKIVELDGEIMPPSLAPAPEPEPKPVPLVVPVANPAPEPAPAPATDVRPDDEDAPLIDRVMSAIKNAPEGLYFNKIMENIGVSEDRPDYDDWMWKVDAVLEKDLVLGGKVFYSHRGDVYLAMDPVKFEIEVLTEIYKWGYADLDFLAGGMHASPTLVKATCDKLVQTKKLVLGSDGKYRINRQTPEAALGGAKTMDGQRYKKFKSAFNRCLVSPDDSQEFVPLAAILNEMGCRNRSLDDFVSKLIDKDIIQLEHDFASGENHQSRYRHYRCRLTSVA